MTFFAAPDVLDTPYRPVGHGDQGSGSKTLIIIADHRHVAMFRTKDLHQLVWALLVS